VAEFGKTFGQAVKFMGEFPEFTFTQSSAAFYQETEASHPALFQKIKKYVKEGRWEIVGGRICEGDTNIISAEAHARQFLYGQRFFRERFGKQAVVAWEPDTFGHSRQMPQIVQLGGCKYYYFCRAGNGRGHGSPLFWWAAPNGSRVLAFEEPVISGWYNDERLDRRVFGELSEMTKRTGSKAELWVYGVGNHGGGPTRESIETAVEWMKEPNLPAVKFSTAQAFFEAQGSDVLARIPVVNDELNSVFEGCYTTHGNIKRWNDDCQAVMVSAETVAAIAARFGFDYPGLKIRQNWEDICWNHHHDTIDGSAQHASYKKSKAMLEKVMLSGRRIGQDAVSFLADKATAEMGDLLVFNPLGARRDAVVQCSLPENIAAEAMRDGQGRAPLQVIDAAGRQAIFLARGLPSVGYQVYRPTAAARDPREAARPPAVTVSADGIVLENENLKVVLDAQTGTIRSLFDKRAGREVVAPRKNVNRLEIHHERPNGMPAWDIGVIDHVDRLESPIALKIVERGPVRCAVEFSRRVLGSTVTQRVALVAGGDSVLGELRIDWKETGSAHPLWPFLKLAFDLNMPAAEGAAEAWYEVPFGAVLRPANGREAPAVAWVDYGTPQFGLSLICDCKHGYSVKDGTLRLSLVRTPTYPDNQSDNYLQIVRYEVFPHKGTWKTAGTVQRALAFVQPLWTAWASQRGTAALPAECSFLKSADPRAVVTSVKRAEDDDDLVVRVYEPTGAALNTQMSLHWPVLSGVRVNFLEDTLDKPVSLVEDGQRILLDLGSSEIRTVKLHLRHDPAAPLRGSRGPSPVRPF
jgi:alpha-mannosidase